MKNFLKNNWVLLLILLFIFGSWYYTYSTLNILTPTERGTFGDMFGGLNALFSGLAFAGIIYTILLQMTELKLQREELKQTREVLNDQKDQLKAQNETMELQRFENTFFQMINAANNKKSTIHRGSGTNKKIGELATRELFDDFHNKLQDEMKEPDITLDNAITFFDSYFKKRQSAFQQYFLFLTNIVKLVFSSNIKNKDDYYNILIANLTYKEIILFSFFISAFDFEKDITFLKSCNIVKESNFFKQLVPEMLQNYIERLK